MEETIKKLYNHFVETGQTEKAEVLKSKFDYLGNEKPKKKEKPNTSNK